MLPDEVIEAIIPGARSPMPHGMGEAVLGHVVALDALEVDVAAGKPADIIAAGYMLTLGRGDLPAPLTRAAFLAAAERWFSREGVKDFAEFSRHVIGAYDRAYRAVIPAGGDPSAGKSNTAGWPVELLEILAANGWEPFDAIWGQPLSRLFAVSAAMRLRLGGKFGGPDYHERVQAKGLKAAIAAAAGEAKNG